MLGTVDIYHYHYVFVAHITGDLQYGEALPCIVISAQLLTVPANVRAH